MALSIKTTLEDYNVPHVVDTHISNYLPKILAVPIRETQIFILIPKLCG